MVGVAWNECTGISGNDLLDYGQFTSCTWDKNKTAGLSSLKYGASQRERVALLRHFCSRGRRGKQIEFMHLCMPHSPCNVFCVIFLLFLNKTHQLYAPCYIYILLMHSLHSRSNSTWTSSVSLLPLSFMKCVSCLKRKWFIMNLKL